MTKENFFPKVTINKNQLIFNSEAIETMELDSDGASVIIIEASNPEKVRLKRELLIMKTNGSLCDDVDNIKDVFSPDLIRKVVLNTKDGEILSGSIGLSETSINTIKEILGDKDDFKLIVCNQESVLGREFKEQFGIINNYYRFVYTNDKRSSVGKEKNVRESIEERININ